MTDTEDERSRAPWTAEQVRSLNGYQGEARMHPFTCGREHGDYTPLLEATPAGWVCNWKGCDYTQDWAHPWMTDWSWRRLAHPELYKETSDDRA